MSFHRNPWLVAEDRYLDKLSDEERVLYTSASAENLFYGTSAAQIRHEEGSKSRAAARRLKPLIAAITQYGGALDVISNTAPLFFAPIWGGLRVLLHIASEFNQYYTKLIDMLEKIGDVIPRFKTYERLFPKHEQLLYSLSAAYLDIITFCADAKDLFQKAKKKKSRIRIPGSGLRALKVVWKPFHQDFGVIMDRFRQHEEKVGMEAELAHMIEQAAERKEQGNERDVQALERAIAEKERKRQLLLHKEQLRDNLLKRLSQCDQDYKHRLIKRMRVEGTSQWILNSDEFTSWSAGAGSSCLWCYGIPGSGKSVLTSAIIDAIKDNDLAHGDLLHNTPLAWFYCDYSEPKTLEPSEVVGNLIKQLLPIQLLTLSLDLQFQLEKIYENCRVPDLDELLDLFSRVVGKFPRVFIVIDGLDECKERERNPLLQWFKTLLNSSTATVKLFISSREEVDIKQVIENSLSIQTTVQNTSSDIAAVVQGLVRTEVAGKWDWSQDPILVQEIIDALIAGARGMFLWVTFQLDEICEEISEDGVRDALGRLPDGLNETFIRALQKIQRRGQTQVAAAQKLFMWLVGGKRTLTLEELREAVSILPSDSGLERGKIPNGMQLVRVCGSLIVYNPQEETIRLAHYTIQQFLLSEYSEREISLQLTNFHLELYRANAEIGHICMTYLCFSAFETQLVLRALENLSASDKMLLQSPTSGWVPKMVGFSQAQTTLWDLFRGNMSTCPTPDIDFAKHLQLVRKPAKDPMHEYKLLGYVIEFWVEHAVSFTSKQPQIWRLFENVVLERNLFFDFQPWLISNPTSSPRALSAFRWALENTHEPLIRLVIGSGEYDRSFLSCALENNEHALGFASRMGHEQTVAALLPAFSSCFDNDAGICTTTLVKSIKLAILNGHDGIAATLLREFRELEGLRPGGPMDEVFDIALGGGHEQILALLRGIGFGTQLELLERELERMELELEQERGQRWEQQEERVGALMGKLTKVWGAEAGVGGNGYG